VPAARFGHPRLLDPACLVALHLFSLGALCSAGLGFVAEERLQITSKEIG
jgi:hypothetical protein